MGHNLELQNAFLLQGAETLIHLGWLPQYVRFTPRYLKWGYFVMKKSCIVTNWSYSINYY